MRWLKGQMPYFLILALAIITGLITFNYAASLFKPDLLNAQGEEVHPGQEELADIEPSLARNPLNGYPLRILPDWRPVAVVIDNHSSVRPQSGLGEADLVYEFPVEGGITRFLGIFYQRMPWDAGPVRSTRPYVTSLAGEWNAVLVHAGGSPQALAEIKDYPWHVEALGSPLFRRHKQKSAPHNLYVNLQDLLKEQDQTKTDLPEVFNWEDGRNGTQANQANKVNIFYPREDGKVTYEFDSEKQNYLRYQGGIPQADALSSLNLRAENIIIQQVDTMVIDGQGRLEMKLLGEGDAWLVSGGSSTKARWLRTDAGQATEFLDAQGKPISLRPGQTWVQLVPTGTRIEIQ